ncbi:hypothetical protein P7H90_08035 [Lactococcus lactis]|uniref:hypothetical protein n=1 Tax=Lactococcus lactis TaxID=1358 RepID=UPI00289246EC|nr:hypothetical protein [Lactococcus lactis]MDT2867629.1 hypothetical protein [Lactococcus lactis]MDT2895333.1 hypothetical protein [Lactococcus lactis]MDT2919234.1 hypothetical protein [Lactococcus lactis]MDT2935629.1 hypothetical protein [Lactococcus lactis]
MKNENFVQIPNKMFIDTNNDEKLVYVKLLQSQMIGYLDKDNRTTMTTVPLLVSLLGWSKNQYSNKKVIKSLNGLKEKGYINFESTQDVFTVQINKWNDKEEHIVPVDWKQSGVKFSGHTQIRLSVIDNLLEGKDFTLYSYAEYRTMKNHQYRICYEEWGFILKVAKSNAFNSVNNTEVIVKVSNGFDSDTNRRETNSYLTFDSVEDVKEVSLKPTYKVQSSKSVVKEEEPELVEDNFGNFEEEEISLKAEAKKPVVKEKKITKKQANELENKMNEFLGNTMENNIFKKMASDKRITSVEQAMEIQDINKPMSLEMWKVVQDSDNYLVRDYGNKKLQNKAWKNKFGAELDEAIHKDKESTHKTKFMSKFLYKTITEYYEDGQELVIGADKLYDYVSHRVVSKDDDDTYLAGNMLPDLKFIKVTEKY